jgi:hypothetical protein
MAAKKSAKKAAAKKSATKSAPKSESAGAPGKVSPKPAKSDIPLPDVAPPPHRGASAPAKPKSPGSAKAAAPPVDVVARKAYSIYRRRVELGLPGDAQGDWLQALREIEQSGVES